MIELYGLYKNGKLACISQDSDALFDKFLDIRPEGCDLIVKKLDNNLKFPKLPRSNESLGLSGDGGPRVTQDTADAIGRAFDRVGLTGSDIDYENDDEWKTRSIIDKINGES